MDSFLEMYPWTTASCHVDVPALANRISLRLDVIRAAAHKWGNASEADWHHSMLGDLNVVYPPRLSTYATNEWWPGLLALDQDLDVYEAYWQHFNDDALPTREEAAILVAQRDSERTISSEHLIAPIRAAIGDHATWPTHAQHALEANVLTNLHWRFASPCR